MDMIDADFVARGEGQNGYGMTATSETSSAGKIMTGTSTALSASCVNSSVRSERLLHIYQRRSKHSTHSQHGFLASKMDKVYQVFVSSTFSDLEDERRQVSQTLAKAGYIASGMELFPATDMQQLEFIKRIIDRCDYYVVIVGGKYGSLADDGKSFTEKEYDYAVSKKIPVLAFLHKNPSKIEVGKTDQDESKSKKLEVFQAKLKHSRIVDFWAEQNDLCTKVVIAVANQVNLAPGVGWVRGYQAIDPKLLQDFEKLRRENEELKKQIAGLNVFEITFPSDLPSPDSAVEIPYSSTSGLRVLSTTWKDVFLAATEYILLENDEEYIVTRAASDLLADPSVSIKQEEITKIRYQLEALGLIRTTPKTSRQGYPLLTWSITDIGRRYLVRQKAIRVQS